MQLLLIFQARWQSEASLTGGLIHFFSYFTILSNTLAACVLTSAISRRRTAMQRVFALPSVAGGVAVSIVVVGVAYSLLLRSLWQPEGVQWWVNEWLHDGMPLVFLGYWWFGVEKGPLRLAHVARWALFPIVYFAFIMVRGASIGVYPYPFIDRGTLGLGQVLLNALAILGGFLLVAVLIVQLDRFKTAVGNGQA